MTSNKRILVGAFAGAHGVRGAVRVKSFTQDPEAIAAYGPLWDEGGARRFELEVIGHARAAVIVRICGVHDRDGAEALKGVRLYAERAALPAPEEGAFYHADLVGLTAELTDGTALGQVRAVHDFGAGDVVEIAPPRGPSIMVPFTRRAVPVVDLAGGRLVVDGAVGLPPKDVARDAAGDVAQDAARDVAKITAAAPKADAAGQGRGHKAAARARRVKESPDGE